MGVTQEMLGALRVVKAFRLEEQKQQRFIRISDSRIREYVNVARTRGMIDLLVFVTLASGTAAVMVIGINHVSAGILTLGALLQVLAYLGQTYDPLKTMSNAVTELQSSFESARRAIGYLAELPETVERPHARPLDRASGTVAFKGVSFSYDKKRPVLREVSFEAPVGSRVGIQGRTGAGKSTLASLLMRFYDPDEGQILLDGVDVRDYRLADLRDQFAIVLQEPVLFSTTIFENILCGRPGATRTEVEHAAAQANAHTFITGLALGYDTEVGERGMSLSGGERQRISLARAFLKDAPVLVLDEPTSAVDVATETLIVDAIERLMQGRTTFVIAHRLSTLEGCDLRLMLDGGRVTVLEASSAAS
jgi:ATP-binding cassette subfamily B protein